MFLQRVDERNGRKTIPLTAVTMFQWPCGKDAGKLNVRMIWSEPS